MVLPHADIQQEDQVQSSNLDSSETTELRCDDPITTINQLSQSVESHDLIYADKVNPNLICPICFTPFMDPVSTPCQHTFCKLCIHRAFEQEFSICPIDRKPLSATQLVPASLAIQNLVNELKVHCNFYKDGCDWTGQRQDLQDHVHASCQYVLERCPFNRCSRLIPKRDMDEHKETCLFRITNCAGCFQELQFCDVTAHDMTCPERLVSCELCHVQFKRKDLKRHFDLDCPSRIVNCPHKAFGCSWEGPLRSASEHTDSCLYEKLKGFFQIYENREVEHQKQVLSLQARIEDLESELGMRPAGPDFIGPETNAPSTLSNLGQELHFLQRELQGLSATVSSFMMQQDLRFLNEHARLREEMQSLRSICHTLQMQLVQSLSSASSRIHLTNNPNPGATVPLTRTDPHSRTSSPRAPPHDNKL